MTNFSIKSYYGTLLDLTLKRTYETTGKLALQIHSWQLSANIFKVMRDSLRRDFYLVSLFFVALKITAESKNHRGMHCALL